ncbi:hypothetical protein C8R46DRAFT_1096640 [Mycena filopes]|nr:hypothetical protein C8R46DRAFT_1096640 [Mycena filopes]
MSTALQILVPLCLLLSFLASSLAIDYTLVWGRPSDSDILRSMDYYDDAHAAAPRWMLPLVYGMVACILHGLVTKMTRRRRWFSLRWYSDAYCVAALSFAVVVHLGLTMPAASNIVSLDAALEHKDRVQAVKIFAMGNLVIGVCLLSTLVVQLSQFLCRGRQARG